MKILKWQTIIYITLLMVSLIIVIYYYFYPVNIKLKYYGYTIIDDKSVSRFWSIVESNGNSDVEKYNIKLPAVDYKKNFIIISTGRKIKKLSYKRISKYSTDLSEKPYLCNPQFIVVNKPYYCYIYIIKKGNIVRDDFL